MTRKIAGMTNDLGSHILTASKKELVQEAFPDHQNLSEHSNVACDAALL